MISHIDPFTSTPLCEIMGRNKSDKGCKDIANSWHNYTTVYYDLFKDLQIKQLRIFELGLGTNNINLASNMGADGRPGASLYGWNEFFVNSKIFGADIDKDILFDTDTIKTFFCDQTDPIIIANMWGLSELDEKFDIIIDDGLHTYDANVCFFENSIHKLAPGGYFIVEDIMKTDIDKFNNKIIEWKTTFSDLEYTIMDIPSYRNIYDNVLLVIHKSI